MSDAGFLIHFMDFLWVIFWPRGMAMSDIAGFVSLVSRWSVIAKMLERFN